MSELLGFGAAARRPTTPLEWHELVQQGFRTNVLLNIQHTFETSSETLLDALSMSARTHTRRKRERRLAPEESDRVLRLVRVLAQAADVLGDRQAAVRWMLRPNRSLGGRTPLSMTKTDVGAEAAIDVLGRLEHGVYG
jgi:putative toxin-antitoxin system antitoxin component (TIGR02293 family)